MFVWTFCIMFTFLYMYRPPFFTEKSMGVVFYRCRSPQTNVDIVLHPRTGGYGANYRPFRPEIIIFVNSETEV